MKVILWRQVRNVCEQFTKIYMEMVNIKFNGFPRIT
jgi:hypothetical protein